MFPNSRNRYGDSTDVDDGALVEGFLRGEDAATATIDGWIVRAGSPFRRRLASDWEDVVQDVRIEVLRLFRSGQYRAQARLRTYLWQVTAHTCIDALRRRARKPAAAALDPETPPASREPSPLDDMIAQEAERTRLTVLEAMPAGCRALWRLILDGASYEEISRHLGVSEGALRVRAHRCRKHATALARCGVAAEADAS